MIIEVRVIPKASRNCIKQENNALKAYLTKPATDGLANEQLIDLLAEYFHVKKYNVRIVRGAHSRRKAVSIDACASTKE
ncbi:MAG: DUF167 domain-containing protein [Candidatus Omnitrophica bacterium]|nr:DUF167 domain-containing protein [Candidatus Omnitrophota bacterium]